MIKRFNNYIIESIDDDLVTHYVGVYQRDPMKFFKELGDQSIGGYIDAIDDEIDPDVAVSHVSSLMYTMRNEGYSEDLLDMIYEDLLNYIEEYIGEIKDDNLDDIYDPDEEEDDNIYEYEEDINVNDLMLLYAEEDDLDGIRKTLDGGANINYVSGVNNHSIVTIADNIEIIKFAFLNGYKFRNKDEYYFLMNNIEDYYGKDKSKDFVNWLNKYYFNKEKGVDIIGLPSGQVIEGLDSKQIEELKKSKYIRRIKKYKVDKRIFKVNLNKYCFDDKNYNDIINILSLYIF